MGVKMTVYPQHIRKKLFLSRGKENRLKEILRHYRLNTVCESALCPNRQECFHRGVATFLILGDSCTRSCGFCAVEKGMPLPVDETEVERVALAAEKLGLRHVVITSVSRDDLADGGASAFARTIRAIRGHLPQATVEVLTPDFQGSLSALKTLLEEKPDVFNHNIETVPPLYAEIRPQADYQRSLQVLSLAKRLSAGEIIIKSGLMVGLGEREEEVMAVMHDLVKVGCDVLTIGQYLAPGKEQLSITEFVSPEKFARYRRAGEKMGFSFVLADVFVRSSYHSEELLNEVRKKLTAMVKGLPYNNFRIA